MNDGVKKSLLKWLLCVLVAAVPLAVYMSVGQNSFINIDDPDYVANNIHVQGGLTMNSVRWAFQTFHSSNWHPLTWLSHELDGQLYRAKPMGHHLTNLAFHIANTVLLFMLLVNLTGRLWAAAWVALLFGVHPMHVESVAWIAERKDVLCGFFFLLTLLAYARYVELVKSPGRKCWPVHGLTLLLFALGLMSKPMVVTLPCILLLLDFWPFQRFKRDDLRWAVLKPLLVEKVPFFVLSALSCWVTMKAQAAAMNSGANCPLATRLAHLPVSFAWYLFKLVWPVDHSIYYMMHGPDSFETVLGALVVLGLVSGLVLWQGRRRPFLMVGWLWFVVMLVPVVGVVQVGSQAYADRYSYLPYIGLFIMLAWGLPAWLEARRWPKVLLWLPAVATVAVCCQMTVAQVHVWHTAESLFKQSVDQDNQNEEAWILYGLAYNHAGNPDGALDCLHHALAINPGNAESYEFLGRLLAARERYDESHAAFENALRLAEQGLSPAGYKYLGARIQKDQADMYLKAGQTHEAIASLEASVDLQPAQPLVQIVLGKTYLEDNQVAKAETAFKSGIELLGLEVVSVEAEMGLATIDGSRGNNAGAMAHYRRVLSLDTNMPSALNNLAWMLATTADPGLRNGKEAVQLAERACKVTKYGEPFYIGTLAAAQAEAGDFDAAMISAQKAHDIALAHGLNAVAAKNEELMKLYQSGHPYHEEPPVK